MGTPVFQAAKNYPEVSFASSTLFHALVTASLKQGFVPSIVRAKDATVAFALHGPEDSRLSIAIVTSELATGQSRDLELQLHWRLNVLYRGALVAVGGEMLCRQPAEPLRRLLAQRLTPIVSHMMLEEPAPSLRGRVPPLGLTICGAAVEWLPKSAAADAVLEGVGVALSKKSLGHAAGNLRETAMLLSWQGRVVAATPTWRRLVPVDRALLLSLAEQVGPCTFDQPGRSWACEEINQLWLPSSATPSSAESGQTHTTTPLAPIGVKLKMQAFSEALLGVRPRRYRMVSVRLYPSHDKLTANACEFESCKVCSSNIAHKNPSPDGTSSNNVAVDEDLPVFLQSQPSPEEFVGIWDEERSLVLSLLEEEDPEASSSPNSAGRTAPADLQEGADACSREFRELWKDLCHTPGSVGDGLRCSAGLSCNLVAVIILDELSQDVITLPAPCCVCAAPPWRCSGRRQRAAAIRRLVYWISALPPLNAQRTQQYVCTQVYAVGAHRREDGVHCWGIMDAPSDGWQPREGVAPNVEDETGKHASKGPQAGRVLKAVAEVLLQVPHSADLRTLLADRGLRQ